MRSDYIDLNRTFIPYDESRSPEEAAVLSYFTGRKGFVQWDDLLAHGRVVLLGEAGSGKTWEMEAQASRLKAQGIASFFVRVDELANRDLTAALAPNDVSALARWRAGQSNGAFFLDAKDEAQLADHHAFERALRVFAKDIGAKGLARARVVVSCRVSEWQPVTDRETVLRLLGPPGTDQGGNVPSVRVVQLAPLDPDRVRRLVSARMSDSDPFMQDVSDAHAWEFARRPWDVESLLAYWRENGRLGNLNELIEFDIARKLTEINPTRTVQYPLDSVKARQGAERLAAGVILTGRFTFPLPESSAPSPTDCLDAKAILIDWREGEVRTLLGRALFDEAAYGKIRFHHRGSVDYLAARWFERLIQANCPQQAVIRLLFRKIYNLTVIPRSLAPVAAWLSASLPSVRRRLMEVDPDVLLRHGDPSQIPLAERERLLDRIADQYRYRSMEDTEQLRRLADPSLAHAINRHLRASTTSDYVKQMMLIVVREGRLQDCSDVCLEIAGNVGLDPILRVFATNAMVPIGNDRQMTTLADLIQGESTISAPLAPTICEVLYPRVIDEVRLADILRKSAPVPTYTRTGLPYTFGEMVGRTLTDEYIPCLMNLFLDLSLVEPWVTLHGERGPSRVSNQFQWVSEPLLVALQRVLGHSDLMGMAPDAVATTIERLTMIVRYTHRGIDRDGSLQKLLAAHPAVCRALVVNRLERLRIEYADDQIWIRMLDRHDDLWHLAECDIPWLLEEAERAPEPQNRRMSFKLAVQLGHALGRGLATKGRIMMVAAKHRMLWSIYCSELPNPLKRMRYRLQRLNQFFDMERVRFPHRMRDWREKIALAGHLVFHIRSVVNGNNWAILYNLLLTGGHSSNRYEEQTYDGVAKVFGKPTAWIVRKGLKRCWRRWPLPVPGANLSTTPYAAVIGLAGIKAEVDDGLDFHALSPVEAETAACLALYENGLPSWLSRLIVAHPTKVRDVFCRQIAVELAFPADQQRTIGLIAKLSCAEDNGGRGLCASHILTALTTAAPPNLAVLSDSIDILIRQGELAALAGLASRYAPIAATAADSARLKLWLATWFQVDAEPALAFLEADLAARSAHADATVIGLAAALNPHHPFGARPATASYRQPRILRRLIPHLFRHIRPAEDVHHEGAYNPSCRDNAQDFRSNAIGALTQQPGQESYGALLALADERLLADCRDYLRHAAFDRARQDGDGVLWTPEAVVAFAGRYGRDPRTADDLFELILGRLEDITEDAERGDFSLRGHFKTDDDEAVLQKWLAGQLDCVRRGMYEVVREIEVANNKMPDIRIVCSNMGPVTIEAKWAHKWSYTQLRDALEKQLLDQYMMTNRSCHGVLLLANLEPRRTWVPKGEAALNLQSLCQRLQGDAQRLVDSRGKGERITVCGMVLA